MSRSARTSWHTSSATWCHRPRPRRRSRSAAPTATGAEDQASCDLVRLLSSLYASIERIEVSDGVITVVTVLPDQDASRRGAELLCNQI